MKQKDLVNLLKFNVFIYMRYSILKYFSVYCVVQFRMGGLDCDQQKQPYSIKCIKKQLKSVILLQTKIILLLQMTTTSTTNKNYKYSAMQKI